MFQDAALWTAKINDSLNVSRRVQFNLSTRSHWRPTHVSEPRSSLRLSNPQHVRSAAHLAHPVTWWWDSWVVSTLWSLKTMPLKQVSPSICFVFITEVIYLKLLVHTVKFCVLTSSETAKLFFTVAPPLCIPQSSVGGFQFLHVLTIPYFVFLITAIPVRVTWSLSVILICISLLIMCWLTVWMSSLEKCLPLPPPFFGSEIFNFKNLFFSSIVNFQCCVNFCYVAEWFNYTSIHSSL